VTALPRGLGESRIGEMVDVGDAALFLLGSDLKLQLPRHTLELGDHHVELSDLLALFADLKSLQPHQVLSCLHYSLLPKCIRIRLRPVQWRRTLTFSPERPHMENNFLSAGVAGNHSFTRIVNHRDHDLRPGKE